METLTNLGPSAQPQDEEPDDRTLLDGFLADDETSFSIIVKRYEEALTAYARQHLNQALVYEAEDTVQEAFTDFFCRRHELLPETSLSGLLHRMVEHKCAFHLRRAGAKQRDFHRTLPLHDPRHKPNSRHDENLIDHRTDPRRYEDQLDLEEMLATLPAKEARAIRLVLLERHTEPEAAEIMDEPVTSVKWWIKDGRERLKRLGANDDE